VRADNRCGRRLPGLRADPITPRVGADPVSFRESTPSPRPTATRDRPVAIGEDVRRGRRRIPGCLPRQPRPARLNRILWQRNSMRSSSAHGQAGPSLAGKVIPKPDRPSRSSNANWSAGPASTPAASDKTLVASATCQRSWPGGGNRSTASVRAKSRVDMAKVKARKERVMLDDRHGLESWLNGMDRCTFIRGHAPIRRPAHHSCRRRPAGSRQNLPQRRWPVLMVPDLPGLSDIDYMTNVGYSNSTPSQNIWSSSVAATSRWSSRRCTAGSALGLR